jgi:diaminohydroxyphosphoribosylaminopyrimidine deaminase / 5-amino-6-(5-phosphoribosylamino)uracil reductase
MSTFSAFDHQMMARALQLAERGIYTTKPNPMVGCVITRGETIAGEAWHQKAGEPHAEALALQQAGDKAHGATAYVTLEPCAHFGRTPPCADALVRAGIMRVVAAVRDPFHSVAGKGFAALEAAGVHVESGLMQTQARELNRGFFSRQERGRPWVRIKMAMSLDGRTALSNGASQWISGEAARADVQHWRARSGAILSGSGTVRADNPRLTVRDESIQCVPPLRVILDSLGRLDAGSQIFANHDAPTLRVIAADVIPANDCDGETISVPRKGGVLDLHAVLAQLSSRGVNEVQVESGATLAGALLNAGLFDELLLYIAPVLLGDKGRPLFANLNLQSMQERYQLSVVDERKVGSDWRLLLRPKG